MSIKTDEETKVNVNYKLVSQSVRLSVEMISRLKAQSFFFCFFPGMKASSDTLIHFPYLQVECLW